MRYRLRGLGGAYFRSFTVCEVCVIRDLFKNIRYQVVRTTSTASIVNYAEQVFLQSGRTVYYWIFSFKNVSNNLRRRGSRLERPSFNLECMHKSFTFLATKLWKTLLPIIRESKYVRIFKRSLETFMSKSV